ncbi:hypothetical protein Nepgr_016068 [Nepenthes gracilis]|uniref:Epidermal patterning factor-like protein n=1 Tax=Nepenthes gracilis TaxID=150966 RepID=A0AAD3SN67_NEPGR|nr:hypothetical protein Nepgr_016068 [Nepenthes gracilis]
MKRRWFCCLLVLALQIMGWDTTSGRHLSPNHVHGNQLQGNGSTADSIRVKFSSKQVPPSSVLPLFFSRLCKSNDTLNSSFCSLRIQRETVAGNREETENYREEKNIGSRPPNCENKCHGCNPCEAIQVPAITGHFSLQYANYLPEGWKCKCGPSFYSP